MTRNAVFLCCCLCLWGCSGEKTAKQDFAAGDYARAFAKFKPRAEAGDSEAQNYLGVQYYMGLGVRRDWQQALKWYEKSAKQGEPRAQRNYGMMFHNGYGTNMDIVSAYMWYYAAYRQGNPTAKGYMDYLAAENKLSPNQMNLARQKAKHYIVNPVIAEHVSESKLFRGQQREF